MALPQELNTVFVVLPLMTEVASVATISSSEVVAADKEPARIACPP